MTYKRGNASTAVARGRCSTPLGSEDSASLRASLARLAARFACEQAARA
jgi:hypothetical protein